MMNIKMKKDEDDMFLIIDTFLWAEGLVLVALSILIISISPRIIQNKLIKDNIYLQYFEHEYQDQ